jgi:hypothetical protein
LIFILVLQIFKVFPETITLRDKGSWLEKYKREERDMVSFSGAGSRNLLVSFNSTHP